MMYRLWNKYEHQKHFRFQALLAACVASCQAQAANKAWERGCIRYGGISEINTESQKFQISDTLLWTVHPASDVSKIDLIIKLDGGFICPSIFCKNSMLPKD